MCKMFIDGFTLFEGEDFGGLYGFMLSKAKP